MIPRELLTRFDAHLASRALRLEAVVIGGAALNLLGVVSRPTKDCDILHPALPPEIIHAACEFAAAMRHRGDILDDDWLNNGPAALAQQLPRGWERRLRVVFTGTAIVLRCLGRDDLLLSKLFALCDRGFDLADCIALAPLAGELEALRPWVESQDLNPDWPAHVRATFADLGKRLGHAV